MRSSSGQHYIALDHLRGLAAFMVVAWHFMHFNNGTPVPFEGAPAFFPLALFDEGHTGVSLFMVLSGYLFAKLLDGKCISYPAFFWNRFIRLAPLLLVVFFIVGMQKYAQGESVYKYMGKLVRGAVFPVWPNGGWSITTEIHFYAMLPVLICVARRSFLLPLWIVAMAVLFRATYFQLNGQVQTIAYWTILGRIDQFIVGMIAFGLSAKLVHHKGALASTFVAFLLFWWWFSASGGFYLRPNYPSTSTIWVFLPTIEGVAYATLIVWYEATQPSGASLFSRVAQKAGEYSYSIYLLHFFFVFSTAKYIHNHVMDISNFYIALVWSLAFFILMLAPGYLSFRFIESPFLRLRLNYAR